MCEHEILQLRHEAQVLAINGHVRLTLIYRSKGDCFYWLPTRKVDMFLQKNPEGNLNPHRLQRLAGTVELRRGHISIKEVGALVYQYRDELTPERSPLKLKNRNERIREMAGKYPIPLVQKHFGLSRQQILRIASPDYEKASC